jgi:60 kDa SS-A/Ro ribonucleoprotein
VLACIKADGLRTVRIVSEVSVAGRAPKNDPAIFALALASTHGDDKTRSAAYNALSTVCRTGTHLFTFMEMRKALGKSVTGGLQRALQDWYTDKPIEKLTYQLIKYQQRGGWNHRDVLRLAKPNGDKAGDEYNEAFAWVAAKIQGEPTLKYLQAIRELAKQSETAQQTADLVTQYDLPREALKTEHLTDPVVWEAMLDARDADDGARPQPGDDDPHRSADSHKFGDQEGHRQITNAEHIAKSKIHPIQLFMALKTYAAGKGLRVAQNTWHPVPNVIDALDDAFYLAFENVRQPASAG